MRRRIITAAIAMAGMLLAMPLASPVAADKEPIEQWRGFWADSFRDTIYTPENVDTFISDAKEAGANALIVQVGRWMDCFCNKSKFPRTHVDIDPEFDPLEYVVERGKAEGIEIHAWVNAATMWNAAFEPTDPNHMFHTNGHDATGADKWLNVRSDGAEIGPPNMRYIDFANPAATSWYADAIKSILDNYDVDGIHFDYIRYGDYNLEQYRSDWGYSETSLARFADYSGRTDRPEPDDPEFSDWRRMQTTNFVRKLYLTAYEADPGARVSMSGITYWFGPQTEGGWERTRTYSEVMQDWRAWMQEGIIDTNVPMNYKVETDVGDRIQMYDEWNETIKDNQGNRHAVIGPGIYLNTVEDSVEQARRALEPSAAGNSVVGWNGYSWATPSNQVAEGADPKAERQALMHALTEDYPYDEDPPFADPAVVPSMPWKDDPTTGHLAGTVALRDGTPLDQVEVVARNVLTGERITGRTTDGAGWFGFVDLQPGLWIVRVDLPRGVVGKHVDVVDVRKGGLVEPRLGPLFKVR